MMVPPMADDRLVKLPLSSSNSSEVTPSLAMTSSRESPETLDHWVCTAA